MAQNSVDLELFSERNGNDSLEHHDQSMPTHVQDRDYVPPDGGYGWVCVACVFMINAHTWGINFAYGVFLDYFLAENIYPDASALDYAFIGGLSISMALIITPLINTSSRLWGTHVTLSIGLVILTASLVAASFATQVWHLYLSQGVCFGWGLGLLYVGSSNIIPQWFSTKMSLANGICAAGAGFGGLLYSLASSSLLERLGPSKTFRILAICQFVANLVCIILIWLVLGWGCLSELGYTVLLFSLPNYARRIGLNAHQGSIAGGLLNLGLVIGRPLVGHSSDTLGRINMATFTTGFCGLICFVIWIFATSFAVLCLFAVLAGLVCGTFWSTIAPVGADIAGLSELPSTLSIVLVLMVVPTTFGESIALSLRRATGDVYLDAQIFTGVMFFGASLCTLFLRSWKIGQVEREAVAKREREGGRNREGQSGFPLEGPARGLGHRTLTFRRLFQLQRV